MIHYTTWISQIFTELYIQKQLNTQSSHGTFSEQATRYQNIGTVPCIFSDHNALKLELNQKKKLGRHSNTGRLKSTVLKDEWINQEIREELKRFMETNENEDTTIQNLWDTAKAVLRGKYITIQAYLKKLEKSQRHKLILYLKELEKEQQINSTPSRRELIKIRAELNEIETRRTVEQINKTKSRFFERINKRDKSLARLLKRREKRLKLIKSRMKRERSQPIPRKYKQF